MKKNTFLKEFEKEMFHVLDLFRSKVQLEEMKYYFLSILALKYANDQKSNFNISEKSEWNNLRNNGIDIVEKIEKAFDTFEKENPKYKNVFGNIEIARLKGKLDSEVFKLVLLIDKLDLKDGRAGIYAEYILDLFVSKEGAKSGDFVSPKNLSKLISSIVNKDNEGTIYDPVVGVGSFLVESAKAFSSNISNIYGQEVNSKTWSLCNLNLLLHGIENASLKNGDVVKEPFTDKKNLIKFDKIIMQPPFSLANWGREKAEDDIYGRFRYGVPGKIHSDLAFLQIAIASLNDKGKAAIVLPYGCLFRSGTDEAIRKKIVENDLIETIIGLPVNIFQGTGIGASIVIINKNKSEKQRNKIHFINAQEKYEKINKQNYLREEDVEWILGTYENEKEIEGSSRIVDINEIKENSYNLNPNRYFLKIKLATELFGDVFVNRTVYENSPIDKVYLKEIAGFSRGYNITSLSKKEKGNKTIKILNISDVNNGEINIDELTEASVESLKGLERYIARTGDVLLSCRGTTNKIVVVPETKENILVSNNFIIIRVFEDFDPFFLKIFLESPIGQYYLEVLQRGSVIKVLNVSDIETIEIPLLTLSKQKNLMENLMKAEKDYKNQIQKINEDRISKIKSVYDEMGILNNFE